MFNTFDSFSYKKISYMLKELITNIFIINFLIIIGFIQ